jgi:VanZ family protein
MTVIILVAILWPGSKLPDLKIVGFDKIAHFCIFLGWAVAVVHDFNPKWYVLLLAAFLLALLTEVIQLKVEGRTFDLYDLLADATGAIVGLAVSAFVIRITQKVLRR